MTVSERILTEAYLEAIAANDMPTAQQLMAEIESNAFLSAYVREQNKTVSLKIGK